MTTNTHLAQLHKMFTEANIEHHYTPGATVITIHETSDGSTVSHAVAVDGEVVGWVVEHRNANGKTIGWGVWGDQGPDGLFPGRDEAANWLIDPEIEFY